MQALHSFNTAKLSPCLQSASSSHIPRTARSVRAAAAQQNDNREGWSRRDLLAGLVGLNVTSTLLSPSVPDSQAAPFLESTGAK